MEMLKNADKPLISIVIPVYKSAKYLDECLSSLLAQDKSIPYEAIISYDKCEDDSLLIIKEHMAKNPNLRLIENEKRLGILKSRIGGAKIAKGQYIAFLDADDKLKSNALTTIKKELDGNDSDIFSFSFSMERNGKIINYPFKSHRTFDNYKALDMLQRDVTIRGFMWQKIYKRELFDNAKLLEFSDLDAMFEDCCLNFSLFLAAKKISTCNKSFYIYREDNPDSGTTTKRTDRLDQHIKAFDLQKLFAAKLNDERALDIVIKSCNRDIVSLRFDAKKDAKSGGRTMKESKKVIKAWKKAFKKRENPDLSSLNNYINF